jgi:hypothetical protein
MFGRSIKAFFNPELMQTSKVNKKHKTHLNLNWKRRRYISNFVCNAWNIILLYVQTPAGFVV